MTAPAYLSFATPRHFDAWLRAHHKTSTELWIRMFKKGSGTPSVDWQGCVEVALAWGWIDGQRKSLDDVSFIQRFTPRRAKSTWSKKNCAIAEQLIESGRMRPAGLMQVDAARKDGRWEQAYAGSAAMVIPEDFLRALQKNTAAKKFYATLNRANLYSIYHRLTTAKREETRLRRIDAIIAQLATRKPFHGTAR